MSFYTWGAHECCLPQGATSGTLAGSLPDMKTGDVLIFEEVIGPHTGKEEDADPAHRHQGGTTSRNGPHGRTPAQAGGGGRGGR